MPALDTSSDTGDVFVWDATLLTGLDQVDAQHHHLVDLFSWLGLHIMGVDQSMARQMARIRAGTDPAEAWAQEEDPLDRRVANLLRMVGQLYHVLAAQNQDLLEANARLEQRVRERTAELEAANRRLEAFSRIDGLLGIANRGYFDQRLREEIARHTRQKRPLALPHADSPTAPVVTISAGVGCMVPQAPDDGQRLLRLADAALYAAKLAGRNRAVVAPSNDPEEAGPHSP